jgi:uncharacterized protein GlcG (DUF336 family)
MALQRRIAICVTGVGLLLGVSSTLAPWQTAHAAQGPSLSQSDIATILDQGDAAAAITLSDLRTVNGTAQPTRMHIAVVARDGKFLDIRSMDDAWVGSIDIAIAKGRTASFFSSNQNALTSKAIGELTQAHDPHLGVPRAGIGPAGPLWGLGNSNQIGISGSQEYRNGIITFAGGLPLYKDGVLVGGVGVSGDSVVKDQIVALAAAVGFAPPANISQAGFGLDF